MINADPFASPKKEVEYTKFKNGNELITACGDEGDKWATAFVQYYKKKYNIDLDQQFTFMWFANAIEATRKIEIEKLNK